jgi:prepilin-type N-terminal cleavage/methylation domain-containing protein
MNPRRSGFTLIELLVVVLIIGVLASIAIVKFASTKDKAYATTMLADLKNLSTAEASYFADHQTYTTSLTPAQYNASAGVTVTIGSASATGWSATASHVSTTRTCGISYGGGAATDGQPTCN